MNGLSPGWMAAPILVLLSLGLIPGRQSTSAVRSLGWLATIAAGLAFVGSVISAVHVMTYGPIDAAVIRWTSPLPVCLGVHVDNVAVVMMTLISFIGLIIARFSMRYLQGDAHQASFFRWMPFTLGSTLLLVISCNLVMLTAAWMLTSFGLHQLLTYYPERTWAIWAARKKFLISRLGDLMLVTALILTYACFGTTEFTEIFAAAEAIHEGASPETFFTSLIGILFVLGAMTKSAQFPFHTWLPDTMETPTPVSALMHAGVINAGGFLVIRLSPIVSLSPIALDVLTLIGAITAIVASVVMLTQTSIKRSLAYSTIAQMGFMMLQCGMGAFSAAMLHIVAHSVYKAHAFLSCGSVLDGASATKTVSVPASSPVWNVLAFVLAAISGVGILFGTFQLTGINILAKPGGGVLGLILALASVQLLWNGFATGVAGLATRSIANALLVTASYSIAYVAMDAMVASSTSYHEVDSSVFDAVLMSLVAIGFVGVLLLQALAGPLVSRRWVRAIYVHAMNGFYIDIPARRLTAKFYGQAAPVQ